MPFGGSSQLFALLKRLLATDVFVTALLFQLMSYEIRSFNINSILILFLAIVFVAAQYLFFGQRRGECQNAKDTSTKNSEVSQQIPCPQTIDTTKQQQKVEAPRSAAVAESLQPKWDARQLFKASPRAAFVMLVHFKRYCMTCHSIELFMANFNFLHGLYPIMLFYEHDVELQQFGKTGAEPPKKASFHRCVLDRLMQPKYAQVVDSFIFKNGEKASEELRKERLAAILEQVIRWQPIRFELPAALAGKKPEEFVTDETKWFQIGYRHMCNFFFQDILNQPAIRELDYYVRLDTDSYILQPVKKNVVEDIRLSGKIYAYNHVGTDMAFVSRGMYGFLRTFVDPSDNHPNAPKNYRPMDKIWKAVPENRDKKQWDNWEPAIYYNNFEVVHVPTFIHHAGFTHYREEVSKTLLIYKNRWGDAPLRYYQIQFFYNPDEVTKRISQEDFPYSHQQGHNPPGCDGYDI